MDIEKLVADVDRLWDHAHSLGKEAAARPTELSTRRWKKACALAQRQFHELNEIVAQALIADAYDK